MPRARPGPYERRRSRLGRHANAEAGPSTLAAPLDPHLELPPGGISEPTANAEQKQTITEEEETPVSDFYCPQVPHVTICSPDVRRPGKPKDNGTTNGANGWRTISTSCAPGSGSERTLRGVRPSTGPWPVSPYPITTRNGPRTDLTCLRSSRGQGYPEDSGDDLPQAPPRIAGSRKDRQGWIEHRIQAPDESHRTRVVRGTQPVLSATG